MSKMRRLNGRNHRPWLFLSAGLFVFLGVAIFSTFLHYGLTYDEQVGRVYGRYIIKWYSTLFKERGALDYYDLYLYGGFFETIAQLIVSISQRVLPLGVYE